MRKFLPLSLFLAFSCMLSAQADQAPVLSAASALPLNTIVAVDPAYGVDATIVKTNAQAEVFWKRKISAGHVSANDWFEYYLAVRYNALTQDKFSSAQPRLDSVETLLEKNFPGTFEAQFVQYWNGNHDLLRVAALLKAFTLNAQNGLVLRQMAGYRYITGDGKDCADAVSKWKSTGEMPLSLLPYAYNVLQSVPQHALLITNGEFDTYPVVFQQQENNVRKDVDVLCISLASRSENRAMIFRHLGILLPGNDSVSVFDANYIRRIAAANPGRKIYVASSVGKNVLSALQNELYVTGLAFRYSTSSVDNLSFLSDNVTQKMKLDDAALFTSGGNNPFDAFTIRLLNLNYILPLTLAAQHCDQSGDKKKAQLLRDKATSIARLAGKENELSDFIGK